MKMEKGWIWFLTAMIGVALSGALLLSACGDDDDDDDDDDTAEGDDDTADDDDSADDDSADDDDSGECTAEAMCQYSVDCGLGYETVEECLTASDAVMADCENADLYVDCVCECYEASPSCSDYLDCGMACFNGYC